MENELKHLIGVKMIRVSDNTIYFENGTEIEFHPFETYVYTKDNTK